MTLVKFRRPMGHFANPALYNSPFTGLLENFFGEDLLSKEFASFVPAVNISHEPNQFSLELSAPGFDKNDFKLELNENTLTISGTHKAESEVKEKSFSRKEFNYGSFQRSFTLPEEINTEAIDAKYENGILKVTLPKKAEEKKENKFEIKVS
ncbi:MAG: Hsp20/alpha crystallin family protein [Bacteroidia bacterium]